MEKLVTIHQAPYCIKQALLTTLWNLSSEKPQTSDVEIIQLDVDGRTSITLTTPQIVSLLVEVRDLESATRKAWSFPVAQCCEQARPRDELDIMCFMDRLHITCRKGFGCAKER